MVLGFAWVTRNPFERRNACRALFFGRPAKTRECGFGCCDGAPRVFLIAQRDAIHYLTVGRLDNVHDFVAVGFDELSTDVMLCDFLECVSLHNCFHRASPYWIGSLRSERGNDDPVKRAVLERRVTVIHVAQRDLFRNQVVEVHPALQVQLCVHRDVALEVG